MCVRLWEENCLYVLYCDYKPSYCWVDICVFLNIGYFNSSLSGWRGEWLHFQ